MITGEPGTPAEVINVGTEEDAVFEFIIPRGEPGGGGGTLDVLATTDTSRQSPSAGGALYYGNNPLIAGSAITHQAGSTDVIITQPGVYQATFHSSVSVNPGTAIPAQLRLHLNLDGVQVAGGVASTIFTSSSEQANLSFSVPFLVTNVPATLQVVVDEDGFTFDEIAFTVIRLGDNTSVRISG